MRLDADFNESDTVKYVFVDWNDMQRLSLRQWGAKRLDDGNWYAFSKNYGVESPWLHDYLLNADGQALEKFIDGVSLHCRRCNLQSVTKESPREEDLLEVEVQPPKSNGKIKHLQYQAKDHRWKLTWQQGGEHKFAMFYAKIPYLEQQIESAKLAALAKRQELFDKMTEQKATMDCCMRKWNIRYKTEDVFALELLPEDYTTANIAYVGFTDDHGNTFGPHLRGRIKQHASGKWCVRWGCGDAEFQHVNSAEEAQTKLLDINQRRQGSINRWKLAPQEEETNKRTRVIQLESTASVAVPMLVTDDPDIVEALGKHQWMAHIHADSKEITAVNADNNSEWKFAADLIVYTKMKSKVYTNNKPIFSSAAEFHEKVYIHRNGNTTGCDLRSWRLYISTLKKPRAELSAFLAVREQQVADKHKDMPWLKQLEDMILGESYMDTDYKVLTPYVNLPLHTLAAWINDNEPFDPMVARIMQARAARAAQAQSDSMA